MADLVIDNTIEAIVLPNGEELELGTTPTGNIDITQAGVTDVSEYATATVPLGEISTSVFSGAYYTENNARKWRIRSWAGVVEGDSEGHRGWINDDTQINSDYAVYKAIPTNTHVTPTTSAQTIGAANTMLEGAVTVDAIPSQYIVPTGTKSINANGTGIDVTEYAAVDVAVPSGTPTLQTKSVSITPSETAQSQTVTPDSGYDGLDEVSVSVGAISSTYVGSGITRRSSSDLTASGATVSVPSGYYENNASKAVASGTEGTPTATKGTVSNHSVSVTPSVTNTAGYISGGTKTGTAVSVSASELVSGTINITSSGNTDVTNYATASVASGVVVLPSALSSSGNATVTSSGTEITLNKSMSIMANVTTAGYVSSISPSTADVTLRATDANFLAENIKSGVTLFGKAGSYTGGGTLTVATKTITQTSTTQTISFTSLSGEPKYWFLRATTNVSSSGSTTYYYVTDLFYDGTNIKGNTFRIGSTRRVQNITSGISQSYSSGTLTITAGSSSGATPGQFYGTTSFGYELVYIY